MNKMTTKTSRSFSEIYKALPDRSTVKAPKAAFVEHIAKITLKSEKTVRMWLNGTQAPDALAQSIIAKDQGVPASVLFPNYKD